MSIALYLTFSLIVLIMSGLLWFYKRVKADRKYALMYMIEKITPKELTGRNLRHDLKEIIYGKNQNVKDHFDEIVEKSVFLDIKKETLINDLLLLISKTAAPKLNIPEKTIYNKLILKEEEYTSIINHHLAIPHILVDAPGTFFILAARCKKGVIFPRVNTSINTIFAIVGSKDQRLYHLKALAAIAQITREADFEKKWLEAKDEEGLRKIILSAERKRYL